MRDFLFEVHTEELPPKSLKQLGESLLSQVTARLQNANLNFTKADFFATPRRLAVLITQLSLKQPDTNIEKRGPALAAAFQNGVPTPACIGFAKSQGLKSEDLITIKNAEGEWVGVKQNIKGKATLTLLPDIIRESLAALPIPKRMRWNSGEIAFIRPVHSVIMLFGNKVLPAEILGVKANRKTKGHRFLSKGWISIPTPSAYEKTLEKKFVIPSFHKRRNKIILDAKKISQKKGTVLLSDALVDEVTGLVEWPVAMCGQFDKNFLQVPPEALIAAMVDHQRYFPMNDKNGALLPYFIFISNIKSKKPKAVIEGNERVLRARLSDAAFFFATDKKIKLIERVALLKNILFQNKLGTLYDKTERVARLSTFIAEKLNVNALTTKHAAMLLKADLTTQLVLEFPELQGCAGFYYALAEGETKEVATAIKEHYFPRYANDQLPSSAVGAILAIADRIDTLVGIFGIHLQPTGDKDPFGLRRSSIGVLRILIEKELNLDLLDLIQEAIAGYHAALPNKNVAQEVMQFMLDRLKQRYQEQNISPQIFASVVTLNITRPHDIQKRIEAVTQFKVLPEAEALSGANKRVSNILSKLKKDIQSQAIDPTLFENSAEQDLFDQLLLANEKVAALAQDANYTAILKYLAKLQVSVDTFFDKVLVMTDDEARRENRLLLLKKLRELFLYVADIALLQ